MGAVVAAGVIDIEVVRPEPPHAVFDGMEDMFARKAGVVGAGALPAGNLGGQHHRLTLVFEGFADNFLRSAACVAVGGVEGVDTFFEGQIDDFS